MSSTCPSDFEEELLRHLGAAYNLARWLMGREEDARDVAQEAYLRALKSRSTFRGEEMLPWLLTIVRNCSYPALARRGHRISTDPSDIDAAAPAETHDPALLAARAADNELLARALAQLPVEFREVIVLHELQGLSYKQVAAAADVPIGTVMSRLARARRKLTEELMRPQYKDLRLAL